MGIPVSSNPFRAIADLILSLPLQYYVYVNIVHSTYVRFQKVKNINFCQKKYKKKKVKKDETKIWYMIWIKINIFLVLYYYRKYIIKSIIN